MKQLGVFLLPLGWDAGPPQGYPPPCINFAGTHLYPWVERDAVRIKCLVQEHNTMYPVRAQTRTALSGDGRTNHEATLAWSFPLSNFLAEGSLIGGDGLDTLGRDW